MIDTFSLLLSHILMFIVVVRVMVHPDVNTEPDISGRHFKQVGPRATREEEAREQLREEQAAKLAAQAQASREHNPGA